MIKINKDLNDIPTSLIPAKQENFQDGMIPESSKMTHLLRLELINKKAYINDNKHNSRYKYDDVKSKLEGIYHGKCAYCEQKVEQLEVEHYRPKSTYYWLAYSWDNLLLVCPTCNKKKGNKFEINDTTHHINIKEDDINNINNLSSKYDSTEKPKMINPEVSDPSNYIMFSKDGTIYSMDINYKYTIDTCKLDRKYLNDNRRKIIDDLRNNLQSELLFSKSRADQIKSFKKIVFNFVKASKEPDNEYLAFRKFAISSQWINEIAKDILK